MSLNLSQHAAIRIRQRGLRERDIDVIVQSGSALDADSVFLRNRDVEREIREHKQAINTLERLRGCRVVATGETVVTVYRASRKTAKRLLRGAR
jgi:hypothetical protein